MASELEREAKQAIALIKSFSLELEHYSPESQVLYWLNQYRAAWIRDAVIEAVYQGRYKIISVAHLLDLWKRRGQPVCHFTSGFEQVISAQLGTPLHLSPSMMSHAPKPAEAIGKSDISARSYGDYLGLSIDSFPVADTNDLVEVYQANGSRQKWVDNPDTSNIQSEKRSHTSDYIILGKSSPIEPFRPTLRQKHLSRR